MAAAVYTFDKENFKKEVKDNVRALYRKNLEEANQLQVFNADHLLKKLCFPHVYSCYLCHRLITLVID